MRFPKWASYLLAAGCGSLLAGLCSASLVALFIVESSARGRALPGNDPWEWAIVGAVSGWTIATVTVSVIQKSEDERDKSA